MRKLFALFFLLTLSPSVAFSQETINQNFLFDEQDLSIFKEKEAKVQQDQKALSATQAARKYLRTDASDIRKKSLEEIKTVTISAEEKQNEAPFGLIWNSSYFDLQDLHVDMQKVEIKDNPESYLVTHLPKPIPFFRKVYIVLGEENRLQRILAYSEAITDNSKAEETLKKYNFYSQLLEKKYGNKQTFFTPAPAPEQKNKNEENKESNKIGNPEFLSQLEAGTAVLYSTYHNNNVAATLSIDVDGDKKSYIIIDYKNLKTINEQNTDILEAL